MPVYQVYFPDEISSEIEQASREDKVKAKEFIQTAVGSALKSRKESKKTPK